MGSVNYEADGGCCRDDIRPTDLSMPGQTRLCNSQNNPACSFSICNHITLGTPQCCPTPFNSNNALLGQIAQIPRQSYMQLHATYANSSYVAPVQESKVSHSRDCAVWLPDVTATKAEPAETPQAASDVHASSRTTKRTAGGEIIRPKGRKLPHHLIERRYRDNLNHQIEVLRNELPTFKSIVACTADIEDTTSVGAKWPSKAVVIAAAVQYIASLERERGQVNVRNTLLCEQVEGLQKLVRCDDCSIVNYLESMQPRMVSG
ncbi:hypothetical protein LTR56_026687 [Elasticomyces elasticus]|nr:hypothetical protein LTR56_026687 [Elasticomyces elasticus]KAK5736392.1 hypothetical protein LTS12_026176 [Elasticomyces elasticus]